MPITASDFQIWQTGGQQITVGPAGPSAVSKDANNKATLGSDALILVQGVGTGASATTHAQVVSGDDPQLINARTPTGHNSTHLSGGSDAISLVTTSAAGLCVPPDGSTILITGGKLVSVGGGSAGVSTDANNKATLGSDSKILVQGTASGIAATTHAQTVSGDDPQLTNARTPIAHEASHVTGSDQIPLASASTKGLLNQTSGNTTDFIDGTNNSQALQPVIWSVRLRSFNAIGNPTFEVDQKNVGNTIANPVALLDRWGFNKAGTMTVTGGQIIPSVLPVVPGTNFLISRAALMIQLTTQEATLGASDYVFVNQIIEGPRFRELSQDVHSLSLLVYSSVTNLKFAIALRDPASAKSLVKLCTIPNASTWTLIPLPNIPVWMSGGNFSSTPGVAGYQLSICLATGTTFIAPAADTWQTGNFIGAPGMDNFASKAVNSQFIAAFVQHEPGALCTTPIDCPFEDNLDSCLRYFQKTYAYNTAIGNPTTSGTTTFYAFGNSHPYAVNPFRKIMAKVPSVTAYNPSTGGVNSIHDYVGGADLSVSAGVNISDKGFQGFNVSAGVPATTWLPSYHWVADTGW